MARPSANPKTGTFNATSSMRGTTIDQHAAVPHAMIAVDSTTPRTAPVTDRRTLSVSSCRVIRAAPAPSAARMAISLRRAAARDSRTFATFAHAISSTIVAAASSTTSAVRISAGTSDVRERHDADAKVSVRIREFLLQAGARWWSSPLAPDRACNAGLQPAEHRQVAIASPRRRLIDDLRHPEIRFGWNRENRRTPRR